MGADGHQVMTARIRRLAGDAYLAIGPATVIPVNSSIGAVSVRVAPST
jgi:hypothetical protein